MGESKQLAVLVIACLIIGIIGILLSNDPGCYLVVKVRTGIDVLVRHKR